MQRPALKAKASANPLQRAAIFLLLLTSLRTGSAQQNTAEASPVATQLQRAIADQQASLGAGDTGAIVSKSRHLAALALQFSGAMYLSQNQSKPADIAFARALEVEDTPELRQQLLATLLLANQPAEASRFEAETLRTQGDTAKTRLLLASACHAADDLGCTITQLEQAVRLEPDSAATHLALGNAFWELNEYQYNADSLNHFTTAQRLEPASFQTNYDLGAILSEYQRFADAEAPLHAAAQADPSSPDPWLQLGMNAFAQGRYTDAEPLLRKAVDLTGTDLQHNQYQIRRALVALSRIASQADPQLASNYAARDAAIHTVMAKSNIAPALSQSTGLVNNFTAQGRADAQKSATHTNAAANEQTQQQLAQLTAQSLNDGGTALARTRDYTAALPLFRLAAQVDAQQPPVLRNLGLAAFHTGNMDEAARAFHSWLQSHPDDALAQQYLQQIAAGIATPSKP
ncbi:tetratricopeptide repeat protein [Terriglobus sp.]|uniref:tetratricopeptide repeat protein n=1 Tax=Terriglobus sp. TaxID=1889013 RepID=UPI003AFFFF42